MIYVGIDDTDMPGTPGTNQLARRLVAALPAGFALRVALRHQLFFDSRVPYTSKNKITAGLFALLLGGIGIHKFYLNQVGAGIVYLLFCWTFIPTIIAFVEGIVLLTLTDDDFARRYPG